MKFKEIENKVSLESNKFTIFRIDGKCFRKFTKNIIKPFDPFMYLSMVISTNKTLKEFFPGIWIKSYIQSDEVSIILNNVETEKIIYNGRIEKLVTLMSGYFSSCFNQTLNQLYNNPKLLNSLMKSLPNVLLENIEEKIETAKTDTQFKIACFDNRVIQCDSYEEVLEYLTWRRKDAIRNSKMSFSRYFFKHKDINGLSSNQAVNKVLDEYRVNWFELPDIFKRGVILSNPNNHIYDDFKKECQITIDIENNYSN